MRKTAAFALFVATLSAGAGTAYADRKHSPVQASAPQPIAVVLDAGRGTVAGSVTAVGANWLTVSDGTGQADVTVRGFLPEGIRPNDPVTVTGRTRHGKFVASQVILADGTAHGAIGKGERQARADDHDDD